MINVADCVIVGGGPAGLSAALMLGRANRKVVVFDQQQPRNAVVRASHGFITHDGSDPRHIRKLALQDLNKYASVHIKNDTVLMIEPSRPNGQRQSSGDMNDAVAKRSHRAVASRKDFLEVTTETHGKWLARKVILATGLREILPAIEGIDQYYGNSLFSCPYCDGWELRNRPIVFISESKYTFHMSKVIAHWSNELTVCTNGSGALSADEQQLLASKGIAVHDESIVQFVGTRGKLEAIQLAGRKMIPCVGGFVTPQWEQASSLIQSLGCQLNPFGAIETDAMGRTSVAHVFAAGDNTIIEPALIATAVADGSRAAIGVNTELIMSDF